MKSVVLIITLMLPSGEEVKDQVTMLNMESCNKVKEKIVETHNNLSNLTSVFDNTTLKASCSVRG